jgi:hypothetical protein
VFFTKTRSGDWLTWAGYFVYLVLGALGIMTNTLHKWADRYSGRITTGFVVCAVLGIFVSHKQATNTARMERSIRIAGITERLEGGLRELSIALTEVSKLTQETVRLQTFNNRLQERLLASSDQTVSLSHQAINTVVGGESFCF